MPLARNFKCIDCGAPAFLRNSRCPDCGKVHRRKMQRLGEQRRYRANRPTTIAQDDPTLPHIGEWREVDDRVICHVCGMPFKSLGAHIKLVHGLTGEEYRDRFGLKRGQPLCAKATSARSATVADLGRMGDTVNTVRGKRSGEAALQERLNRQKS